MNNLAQIQALLREVEQLFDAPLQTSLDFEELSEAIHAQLRQTISPSTLKRLWGYVQSPHTPRRYTLDLLSNYCHYEDFLHFCTEKLGNTESSFINSPQILSQNLTVGTTVEIGWSPNRYLLLEYQGQNTYKITEANNSKLLIGDTFQTPNFMLNFPLFLNSVIRNGENIGAFVAGEKTGLTVLNLDCDAEQ